AGVMAAGYSFGPLLLLEPTRRKRTLLCLGIGLTAAFILIRFTNFYGDPNPWSVQNSFLFTCFSFVNCTKYPPSLLFLLMTLGPSILLVGLLTRTLTGPALTSSLMQPFLIFGRVPMFYYLLHLPLIHLLAVTVSIPHYRQAL